MVDGGRTWCRDAQIISVFIDADVRVKINVVGDNYLEKLSPVLPENSMQQCTSGWCILCMSSSFEIVTCHSLYSSPGTPSYMLNGKCRTCGPKGCIPLLWKDPAERARVNLPPL